MRFWSKVKSEENFITRLLECGGALLVDTVKEGYEGIR